MSTSTDHPNRSRDHPNQFLHRSHQVLSRWSVEVGKQLGTKPFGKWGASNLMALIRVPTRMFFSSVNPPRDRFVKIKNAQTKF